MQYHIPCIPALALAGLVVALGSAAVALGPHLAAAQRVVSRDGPKPSNERLKVLSFPDKAIDVKLRLSHVWVDGVWIPESNDPKKALDLPEQVEITCDNDSTDAKKCIEVAVQVNAFVPWLVGVGKIEMREYQVASWNINGLMAVHMSPCQREVLTIDFESGRARVSDIPTPRPGTTCTLLDQDTHSYRLVRGHYYVDTTSNNDVDKQGKTIPK